MVRYRSLCHLLRSVGTKLDNNTVEIGVEQARYGRAVADYRFLAICGRKNCRFEESI